MLKNAHLRTGFVYVFYIYTEMYASIYVIFDVHAFYQRVKNENASVFFGATFWLLWPLVCVSVYNVRRTCKTH